MTEQIKIIIDGKECTGKKGESILKIAEANGIEIPTLCHNEKVKVYGACGVCIVEAEGVGKLLRSCSTAASDGMVIHTDSERVIRARRTAFELLMSDHTGDCRGPCVLNCPAQTDCQKYVKQISEGDYAGAVKTIKEKIPIPSSIGRVCPHPCEKACRRAMVEEPISIAYLKAFAADRETYVPEVKPDTGRKVTVIGAGPAGLTAAYYLRSFGHSVTVIEGMPQAGGMLRYGIPEYRLPKKVLDKEIKEITDLGVEIKTNVRVGKDITLEEIRKQSDAVVIAIGAWTSSSMRVKGEELDGVIGGIDFLRNAYLYVSGESEDKPAIGEKTAIVGGGNTAMDACRTAVRLGAKEVNVIYRRTRAEMPAEDIEIKEAEEEGVVFRFLCNPAEILGKDGKVNEVKLQKMKLGEPDASGRRRPEPIEGEFEYLRVDSVIAAIGQYVNVAGFEEAELNKKGIISADETTFRTSLPDVFAVGDATNKGAGIAIAAIAEAGKAAKVIDGYLRGEEKPYHAPYYSEKEVTPEMLSDREKEARAVMAQLEADERTGNFREVNLGFTEEQARGEAKRCLECGCHDYEECSLIRYARDPKLDIRPERLAGSKSGGGIERKLVSIERDSGKCVLCSVCVRICDQSVGKGILGLVGRGFDTVIRPEFNDPAVLDFCRNCLECANNCPTGALKII